MFASAVPVAVAPAGGAAVTEVVGVSIAAALLTVALLWLGQGHRTGRVKILGHLAAFSERVSGLPGWAALPSGLASGALLVAVFGMYWDISLHIDNGRDPGPLANPAHYFILAGLFGIFAAGWLSICLPEGRPSRSAIRLSPTWYAPISGILLMATSTFALVGFPLDDVFHRLFGQDVTLWGPTHLMLIGGAGLSLIGMLALLTEGRLAPKTERMRNYRPNRWDVLGSPRGRVIAACGGLLIGLSTFQGEFDFGVPQFRLLFAPVLVAFAAACALTTARVMGGRGGAFAAAAFWLVVRGGLAVIVGPILGETTPLFFLYVGEAILVEALALRMDPRVSPLRFGAVAGVLIGTLGTLSEFGWSHAVMPQAWPAHILPTAIALAVPVGIAGGVLGGFLAGGLALRADVTASRSGRLSAAAALVVLVAVLGALLPTHAPKNLRAVVRLTPAGPGMVNATARFNRPDAARDADWLEILAWQGQGKLMISRLKETGTDGVYRTSEPVPVSGDWKTTLRLHKGSAMSSLPVHLPEDAAIPAPLVAASARFDRALIPDKKLLQRERKKNVPTWLFGGAAFIVLSLWLVLIVAIGWGLGRLAAAAEGGAGEGPDGGSARAAGAPPRAPVTA